MQRAYSLMRRDEEVSKMNELWWKNFKLLKLNLIYYIYSHV